MAAHRSLHCLPVLFERCAAMSFHERVPCIPTKFFKASSSSAVHRLRFVPPETTCFTGLGSVDPVGMEPTEQSRGRCADAPPSTANKSMIAARTRTKGATGLGEAPEMQKQTGSGDETWMERKRKRKRRSGSARLRGAHAQKPPAPQQLPNNCPITAQ